MNKQELVRPKRHPSAQEKKAGPSKQKATQPSDLEAEQLDQEPQETETDEKDTKILELKKTIALMGEHVKHSESKTSHGGRGQKGKTVSLALDNLVFNLAKTDLFKEVKFISNEDELEYATRLVMNMIDPQEHQDLTGKKLAEAEAKWIAKNCKLSMTGGITSRENCRSS